MILKIILYVPVKGKEGMVIMKTMYKVNVSSYIANYNTYVKNDFRNEINDTFIFNKDDVDEVLTTVKDQIQDVIIQNGYYGGIDNSVPTSIEISAESDLHIRGYISFSCVKVYVMVVVDFIQE